MSYEIEHVPESLWKCFGPVKHHNKGKIMTNNE